MGGTHLLPEVVGEAHARDLLLTGRVVDADEALRIGLVSRVLDPATFLDDVLEIAAGHRGLGARSPPGSPSSRSSDGGHADLESALQWEAMAQPITLATEDLQEGIRGQPGEAATGVPRPLSPSKAKSRGPRACRRRPAFPLRISLDGPGGLVWGATLGAACTRGQRRDHLPCGQPCGQLCAQRRPQVEDTPRRA